MYYTYREFYFFLFFYTLKIFSEFCMWLVSLNVHNDNIKKHVFQISRCAICADMWRKWFAYPCCCFCDTNCARKSTNVNVKKNNTLGFSPEGRTWCGMYIARTIIISIRNANCVPRCLFKSFVDHLVTPYSPRAFQHTSLVYITQVCDYFCTFE